MTRCIPIVYTWDGEHMVPLERFMRLANGQFTVNEEYRLDIFEERSTNSHNHYFAELAEIFNQLPEAAADKFKNIEHLRKHLLIKTGHYSERTVVLDTPEDAERVAKFLRKSDDYSIVSVGGCVITEFVAVSQSRRSMGARDFQKSKSDVLAEGWSMIGVSREIGARNTGRSA